MKRVDLIAFTEGCYRLDLDLRAWMALIGSLVAPEFDHGFGVIGWLVRFPAPFQAEPVGPAVIVGGPAELAAMAHAMNTNTPPAEVRAAYLAGRPLRSGSELAIPGSPDAIREHRGNVPIKDALGLATVDGEGFALSFAAPTQELVTTSAADRARWMPLAAHLAAGFRLRRRLTAPSELEGGVEAIFTPDGKCLDAHGPARTVSARDSLRAAVRVVERARGPLRSKDPQESLRLWQGLVTGRWSLVDTFTSDGKRYVVARENSPGVCDPRALSEAERQIVNFAAAGQSNKLIAYTLGVSISTVGMHLATAVRKLGIRSRTELGRLHAVSNELAEVRKLEVGGEPLTALILPINRARLDSAKITAAERSVAEGIIEGATNAQIAARRNTSVRTVANQVAALLLKLHVHSRTELVARFASASADHAGEAR